MPAPFIIPFNNCPVSTSIKTSSYTIPAGKYARVTSRSAYFSVDSFNFYYTSSESASIAGNGATQDVYASMGEYAYVSAWSVVRSGSVASGSSSIYIYSGGYDGRLNNTTLITRSALGTTTGTAFNTNVRAGTIRYVLSSSNAGSTGSISFSVISAHELVSGLWVPSGTVLTGNEYIVEEYNMIS
jgi:hypothetical protein